MECGNGEGRRDDLEELTQDKTLIVNSGLPQIMDCLKVGGKSAERNYTDHEKNIKLKTRPSSKQHESSCSFFTRPTKIIFVVQLLPLECSQHF